MSETNQFNRSWLNGRLRYEYINPSAQMAQLVGYHPNGKCSFLYFLKDGKLDGFCRAWHETGKIKIEEVFTTGRLLSYKEWFANGRLKLEIPYRQGRIHGIRKAWYKNGQLARQCSYVEYMRHGVATSWYPNGRIKSEEKFNSGRFHGINTYWDENGQQSGKQLFIRGHLINTKINHLINSGELTAKHILKINNAEVRRVCLEELGYGRFLNQLEHEIIDRAGDYELVKVRWHIKERPIVLVKVKCPSTGAFYVLRVPPSAKTVREAVAWTFGMSKNDYMPEEES